MIRLATAADLDAIVALHTEARATYYRGHVPDADFLGPEEVARSRAGWAAAVDRGAVLCAVRDGEVAGIAAYGQRDGLMHLTQLHVLPARWRAGVGAELHTACTDAWRAAGVTEARLEVFEKNERAQAFYATRGWTPDPEHPRDGSHLVLRLTLAPETE
ncbi:GNAT family N-acetyltransferase [Streptomyces sp. NPDC002773]|uniref:GNAT family N-acetyltransferase n=1 Tax=Streptomyces sp. NPDC002773 TaxID=3154430 RepID=UPI00332F14C5